MRSTIANLAFVLPLIAAGVPAAAPAQQATPFPGLTCALLAARQELAGSTTIDFRVIKMTVAPGASGSPHVHAHGEIMYLLSGSGTSSVNGASTPILPDHAYVIPAGKTHNFTATGTSPLVMLEVQFPDHDQKAFDPKSPSGPDICDSKENH
jgi:mannose-6-phosphate isomerase-like protein (cupin superfamily)